MQPTWNSWPHGNFMTRLTPSTYSSRHTTHSLQPLQRRWKARLAIEWASACACAWARGDESGVVLGGHGVAAVVAREDRGSGPASLAASGSGDERRGGEDGPEALAPNCCCCCCCDGGGGGGGGCGGCGGALAVDW